MTQPSLMHQRNLLTSKLCQVLFLAFQMDRAQTRLFESFATACGGFQEACAWILSAMVSSLRSPCNLIVSTTESHPFILQINCHSDQIRGIGIQCLVIFVRVISCRPDQPLDIPTNTELNKKATLQENTIMLMHSVGTGIMGSNVGRGIAAMAGSKPVSSTRLTPRVIYKLLWHLIKSHRYRMKQCTNAGLVTMVFERKDDNGFTIQDVAACGRIDFVLAESKTVNVATISPDSSIVDDGLGVTTLFRLLRFLPHEYLNQWLGELVDLATHSFEARTALSSSPNWQGCLFQLVSESIEKTCSNGDSDMGKNASQDVKSEELQIFDRSLELYGLLLGRLFRIGGDRVRPGELPGIFSYF